MQNSKVTGIYSYRANKIASIDASPPITEHILPIIKQVVARHTSVAQPKELLWQLETLLEIFEFGRNFTQYMCHEASRRRLQRAGQFLDRIFNRHYDGLVLTTVIFKAVDAHCLELRDATALGVLDALRCSDISDEWFRIAFLRELTTTLPTN